MGNDDATIVQRCCKRRYAGSLQERVLQGGGASHRRCCKQGRLCCKWRRLGLEAAEPMLQGGGISHRQCDGWSEVLQPVTGATAKADSGAATARPVVW